jgi:threonine aldolase
MTTHTIDLRSDTVTKPTPAMLEAMATAPVGDDVYGEDPTVTRLEAIVAELAGKEAAVFVPSGTMGNLIAVLSHCGRGDEMILGDQSHIHFYEQGGTAALGGVHPRTLRNRADGTLDLREVEAAIRGDNEHFPVTRLVCLETTQNRCGGVVLPLDYMDAAGELAHRHGLPLHVDGARLWNAAVQLGVSPARLLQGADSASLCLSKGLAAPVGSVVVGSAAFIRKVRRNRKVVGGGMRQAGVIAAAGIVAVTAMVERLADDHENARALARGLAEIEGLGGPRRRADQHRHLRAAPRGHDAGAAGLGAARARGAPQPHGRQPPAGRHALPRGPHGHRAHPGRLSRGLVGEHAQRVERAWATWSTSGSLTLR